MKRTREEVIDRLRRAMEAWENDEHSLCQVAAEKGLFCHGFAQWKFAELKERYPQVTRSRPALTREELEELANRWQLARKQVTHERTACDVQRHEKLFPQCRGWDQFDDRQLERFHLEICEEPVEIVPGS